MVYRLNGKRVAILVANGFEQIELTEPRRILDEAGAKTEIVSPETNRVKGWKSKVWGDEFLVDVSLDEAQASHYDALLLPGGVMNPDSLRLENKALEFIRDFSKQDKPIAAICHGPWLLINAELAKGVKLTSWPSIKQDLINAGAKWVDQEAVIDGKILTSRKPDDIPAFSEAMVKLFSQKEI
ncbi:MAG: type 1 glutamine amidotransferase [Tatlockia sp.]|nr:type 1 glutamine amidotransferase [Tatlockia sp.]